MKVLFLDIDGVLNGHDWDDEAKSCNIRRECVKHLNRVVSETGCRIVVSSSWRYMVHGGQMTLTGFWYMLRTHGLTGHGSQVIIDVTRKDDEPVNPDDLFERGRQVGEWLSEHQGIEAFVAVDDEDLGFSEYDIQAVITDGAVGLTDADADRLIAMLGRADRCPVCGWPFSDDPCGCRPGDCGQRT
jgi:hypothetical protein